jgi:hypothetical protein
VRSARRRQRATAAAHHRCHCRTPPPRPPRRRRAPPPRAVAPQNQLSIGLVSTNPTACRGGPCAYEGKELFQYQEVMIDDKGLRLDTRQGGQEWHHVLSSARRASLQAQVRPVPGSAFIAARAARRTPATAIGAGCTCSGRRARPLSLLPDV